MNDRPASSVIVLATLCVLVLTCRNTSAPDPQAPVATMRSGTVYYRQIRCSPRLRTDPQRCTQIEQDNLNRRLYGLLIESAASQLGLQLTAEELAAIETHVRREHPGNVAAAGRMRALLKGVARIHRGESQSAVERELFPLGISREQLAEMATRYPTVADADEALAIDFVGTADKSVRQFYRRELLEPNWWRCWNNVR